MPRFQAGYQLWDERGLVHVHRSRDCIPGCTASQQHLIHCEPEQGRAHTGLAYGNFT